VQRGAGPAGYHRQSAGVVGQAPLAGEIE
jgi:hypothetical protein